ncbi:MAG: ABC transporter ATP-binding protein, partial [Acidimicrobiia bacterium]|nr:ABC transporter ATP-binding protein [Acidimicrobiia bacterium]
MTAEAASAAKAADLPDPTAGSLLAIRDLSVTFETPTRTVHAVNGVTLDVQPAEVYALVGESGSGKSVSMLSVMGLVPTPPGVVRGSIRFEGRELLGISRREMNALRGKDIGMVFQDPMSSLNPVHPIGKQIAESLRLHEDVSRSEALERAIDLLDRVGIPNAKRRVKDYPHEFSGGMRQRVMIAIALACSPRLLIADEPTTALDVTVQRQIVALVKELQSEMGMSVVWITHDLGVVAEIADRVAVMYGGRILETGESTDVYGDARHPYTSGLLHSIPRTDTPLTAWLPEIPGTPRPITSELTECPFVSRCPLGDDHCTGGLPALVPIGRPGHASACVHHEATADSDDLWPSLEHGSGDDSELPDEPIISIDALKVHFPVRSGGLSHRKTAIRAVDGVSLDVYPGRTLGVVGESGCGKSTLGLTLVGLNEVTDGAVTVEGRRLDPSSGKHRRTIQMIFQDPFSSMNPGMRVTDIVAEPLRIHKIGTREDRTARATALLERVGLTAEDGSRHPHEFSGGQRQRIAIARALAADPKVIVCDEPVSALDVSVQAQIVNLLRETQLETGVALIFIAHDLAVVRHVSHEIAVMYLGQVVERASRDVIYDDPLHPYTKALLAAVPVPDPDSGVELRPSLEGDLPDPADPPPGCRFHTRCPVAVDGLCNQTEPQLAEIEPGRWVSC